MHLALPHLIYSGPPIDDPEALALLPASLQQALGEINGCVAWRGAFHVRGACRDPSWHALHSALRGPQAYSELYSAVHPSDHPFAEDAFGDQFLVRDGTVVRLEADSGTVSPVSSSLEEFFRDAITDLPALLGYDPTAAVALVGGTLEPGKLLLPYPPFILEPGPTARTFRAIPCFEHRVWLADFASQTRGLPDGTEVNLKVVE